MEMAQHVVVTQAADRHEALHRRSFALTLFADVPAGPLAEVLSQALEEMEMPEGRYIITVDWPHERE